MVPAVPARIVSRIWCSRSVTVLPPAVVPPTGRPLAGRRRLSCYRTSPVSRKETVGAPDQSVPRAGPNPRAERLGRAIRRVAVAESSLQRRA